MSSVKSWPAPIYIMGIDLNHEPAGVGYVFSVTREAPAQLSSLPTNYPLNCDTLWRLWSEVKEYWARRDIRLLDSFFK